jgi:hypothetical protein
MTVVFEVVVDVAVHRGLAGDAAVVFLLVQLRIAC